MKSRLRLPPRVLVPGEVARHLLLDFVIPAAASRAQHALFAPPLNVEVAKEPAERGRAKVPNSCARFGSCQVGVC